MAHPLRYGAAGIAVIALTITSFATLGTAQTPTHDMVGTWVNMDGEYAYWDGRTTRVDSDYEAISIVVSSQDGATFFADQVVVTKADDHPGRHGTEPLGETKRPMLGVVSLDNTQVIIADIGDTTAMQCTIRDEDTLECLIWEAGDHALAGRGMFKRQQR